jgi:multidrug efflux pump subunit AcrA (membrane-fusion protein)
VNQSAPVSMTKLPPAGVVSSASAASDGATSMIELLRIEGQARSTASTQELAILIANETRKLTRARQIFVFERQASGPMTIQAATGLPVVDRTVPLIQCLERAVSRLAEDTGLERCRDFILATYAGADDQTGQSYPLQQVMWFPIKYRAGAPVAGVLMAREDAWSTNDQAIVDRLSLTYAQAWYWLATSKSSRRVLAVTPKRAVAASFIAIAVSLFPVSMTTLAPLVLAPRNQLVVTAPLDGVIQDIPIEANEPVKVGQTIVHFNDTALRSRLAVADREVEVADARVKKTMLIAVNDISGRHELAIAKAELNVKTAERNYAHDVLGRATVIAEQPGIAILGDKRDLVGKPVVTGEKILEIANAEQVELHVDVPVSDVIVLKPGARVKAYLDSDPLRPLEAKIIRADYQAKMQDAGALAFRVVAELDGDAKQLPRLGTRGTAQIFGDRVPLIYFLFRRPLTSLRQWTGL